MTHIEYINTLNQLIAITGKIEKELRCLDSLKFMYIQEKFQVGCEYMLMFDLPELWDEYNWKASKCIYFLSKYLECMSLEIQLHKKVLDEYMDNDEIFIGTSGWLREASYHFDAFVLAACAILEQEEKDYMAAYLKRTDIASFYPSKKEIGLYWQLNLLRNRIIHHTGGRFDNGEVCQRFFDFSSRINGIRVKNRNIEMECTQIDVYRSTIVQSEIMYILVTGSGENIFDRLFPDKKGKGHGKNKPVMIQPGVTLYFDHVSSGVRLVTEIQNFILNMDEAFFVEFSSKIKEKGKIPEVGVIEFCEGEEVKYQIKDVFDTEKIS